MKNPHRYKSGWGRDRLEAVERFYPTAPRPHSPPRKRRAPYSQRAQHLLANGWKICPGTLTVCAGPGAWSKAERFQHQRAAVAVPPGSDPRAFDWRWTAPFGVMIFWFDLDGRVILDTELPPAERRIMGDIAAAIIADRRALS